MSDKITIKYPIASNMRLVESYIIADNILVNVIEEKPTLKIGGYYEIESIYTSVTVNVIFNGYNLIGKYGHTSTAKIEEIANIRSLSKFEINEFNKELQSNGYKYNHETNKLVELCKRVKKCEVYYFISTRLRVIKAKDNRDTTADENHFNKNYFTNETNAKIKLKEIINILN